MAGLVHVDLIDGKFWIQRDGTERGIARDLEDAAFPNTVSCWPSAPPTSASTPSTRWGSAKRTQPMDILLTRPDARAGAASREQSLEPQGFVS